ncbi:MAG: hypothetical protein KF729_37250 [Sandaracinaceae bacterium]|nr:hypothetical protein [Sandaracinaceae bacterium]
MRDVIIVPRETYVGPDDDLSLFLTLIERLGRGVDRVCNRALDELDEARACPEAARSIEEAHQDARSPVVAARFAGATAAVHALWAMVRDLVADERAALERARPTGGRR